MSFRQKMSQDKVLHMFFKIFLLLKYKGDEKRFIYLRFPLPYGNCFSHIIFRTEKGQFYHMFCNSPFQSAVLIKSNQEEWIISQFVRKSMRKWEKYSCDAFRPLWLHCSKVTFTLIALRMRRKDRGRWEFLIFFFKYEFWVYSLNDFV